MMKRLIMTLVLSVDPVQPRFSTAELHVANTVYGFRPLLWRWRSNGTRFFRSRHVGPFYRIHWTRRPR